MVLGMLFENFKNVYILRYVNYELLKKVLGGPQPTCLVRVHCALCIIPATVPAGEVVFHWQTLNPLCTPLHSHKSSFKSRYHI